MLFGQLKVKLLDDKIVYKYVSLEGEDEKEVVTYTQIIN